MKCEVEIEGDRLPGHPINWVKCGKPVVAVVMTIRNEQWRGKTHVVCGDCMIRVIQYANTLNHGTKPEFATIGLVR